MITESQLWTALEAQSNLTDQQVAAAQVDRALRRSAQPVGVVCAGSGGRRHALTVTSFQVLPSDQFIVTVAVRWKSTLAAALSEAEHFALHVLSEEQSFVADMFFGTHLTDDAFDFDCVDWTDRGLQREPFMVGASLSMECQTLKSFQAGSAQVFVAIVREFAEGEKAPLLCWAQKFCAPRPLER